MYLLWEPPREIALGHAAEHLKGPRTWAIPVEALLVILLIRSSCRARLALIPACFHMKAPLLFSLILFQFTCSVCGRPTHVAFAPLS